MLAIWESSKTGGAWKAKTIRTLYWGSLMKKQLFLHKHRLRLATRPRFLKRWRTFQNNKMHAQRHAAARPDFPDFLRTGRGGAPPPCSGGAGLRPSTRARALSTRPEVLTHHHFQRKENKSRCSSFFLQNSCFRDPPVFLLSHMAW